VLAMRIGVHGRAAHSSTPWLGDNAVLKAIDTFRAIETLPFTRESSQMFDRPSINLSQIAGGDVMNKVPDFCEMAVDVRYLPGQDPGEILAQVRAIPGIDVTRTFIHPTVSVSRTDPYVLGLEAALGRSISGEVMSVGRDGASDAASFIEAGIPAVEFGPAGGGHHGPEEWVSLRSLGEYRRALAEFIGALPAWLRLRDDDQVGDRQVGDRQVGDREPHASHSDLEPHASHSDLKPHAGYSDLDADDGGLRAIPGGLA
jgi:succinyl-diaminopimelate desuccinylase